MRRRPNTNLCIEWVPPSRLTPTPGNPRTHSDRQIKQLARTIGSLGFNSPILTDPQGQILAGHGRWLAAQKLGLQTYPLSTINCLPKLCRIS